ncbi:MULTISPECIES: hypothetical protein [unclassified Curtobacterium]|uniref:hypothetical protein n=1 Tax=unclassified Curtobacterium TaxID=257496 RepID=UPI0010525F0F|nr:MULTISPECIES: hypothetical protein [unclassified Curtobacterium]
MQAESGPIELEEHLTWVATLSHEDEAEQYRVIIATLHGAWEAARAEVTIGVQIGWLGESVDREDGEYLSALAKSDALESTYDIARAALVSLLATVAQTVIEVPTKSPDAEVFFYEDQVTDGSEADSVSA